MSLDSMAKPSQSIGEFRNCKMTDLEIREKIEGYLARIESGEDADMINDGICDFCQGIGERAWDIRDAVLVERGQCE
jgi:hypothetical protein